MSRLPAFKLVQLAELRCTLEPVRVEAMLKEAAAYNIIFTVPVCRDSTSYACAPFIT